MSIVTGSPPMRTHISFGSYSRAGVSVGSGAGTPAAAGTVSGEAVSAADGGAPSPEVEGVSVPYSPESASDTAAAGAAAGLSAAPSMGSSHGRAAAIASIAYAVSIVFFIGTPPNNA